MTKHEERLIKTLATVEKEPRKIAMSAAVQAEETCRRRLSCALGTAGYGLTFPALLKVVLAQLKPQGLSLNARLVVEKEAARQMEKERRNFAKGRPC